MIQISIWGFLLIVIYLLIQNPDRAEKLKALILEPTFKLFKWGSHKYLATKVASLTTEFFNRHLISFIPALKKINIKIKWVNSSADPVFKKDGTVIIRIRETNDQTLNYLTAAQAILPRVICPSVRYNIKKFTESAIDLALLKKFSEKLGKHAQPLFQKYFLTPAISEDPDIKKIFQKLVEIDTKGTFVTIFLQELNLLGELLFGEGDTNDYTEEILSFLNFLVKEANRKVGQDIELEHISKHFKLAIVLVAKSWKAETKGVTPYINRVDINLKKGCDSIYIIAYPRSFDFLKRLLNVLEGDGRISVIQKSSVQIESADISSRSHSSRIVLLRRNKIYDTSTFEEQVKTLNLKIGDVVEGNILDISESATLVNIMGINGIVNNRDSSWLTVLNCKEMYVVGDTMKFLIKDINKFKNQVILSRRFPENNPFNSSNLPKVGSKINVRVSTELNENLICIFNNEMEFLLPKHEISWLEVSSDKMEEIKNTNIDVKVTDINKQNHIAKCSLRQLDPDPWPQIQKRFRKGQRFNGRIVEITSGFVRVSLPDGYSGIIPRIFLEESGFENVNYEDNFVIGQGIDVVISKIFTVKRKIRLNLTRNIEKRGNSKS
jgi:predicted RNA-binding protein with RPS1 domain